MTAAIGIDPGLSGAVAFLDHTNLVVVDMPTLDGQVNGYHLTTMLGAYGPVDTVCVEEVSIRPGEAGRASLTIGTNYGIILGVLAAMSRPLTHARPATWTAALSLPKAGKTAAEKRKAKEARVLRACELWPNHADLFHGPRGGLLDGRADAALIAHYALTRLDARSVA